MPGFGADAPSRNRIRGSGTARTYAKSAKDIPNTMHRRAVIFDFDYTLADSSSGVIESVRYALESLGLPMVAEDAVRPTIGLSLSEAFRTLVHSRHWPQTDEFLRLFAARADQVVADLTVLYKSVELRSNSV